MFLQYALDEHQKRMDKRKKLEEVLENTKCLMAGLLVWHHFHNINGLAILHYHLQQIAEEQMKTEKKDSKKMGWIRKHINIANQAMSRSSSIIVWKKNELVSLYQAKKKQWTSWKHKKITFETMLELTQWADSHSATIANIQCKWKQSKYHQYKCNCCLYIECVGDGDDDYEDVWGAQYNHNKEYNSNDNPKTFYEVWVTHSYLIISTKCIWKKNCIQHNMYYNILFIPLVELFLASHSQKEENFKNVASLCLVGVSISCRGDFL